MDNEIGRNVRLSKACKMKAPVKIGDDTILRTDVELSENVVVGYRCDLSRITVGKNSQIDSEVICTGYGEGKIFIGEECYIGIRNILDWSNDIRIGNFVHIAGGSSCLWTHTSYLMALRGEKLSGERKSRSTGRIRIEDHVYIGGNCTIYPNVSIGNHSVVLPNSAIDKDVESFSMVGGVPGKLIKRLDPKEFGLG
jgi:acetyltransferase-like isoleucine patch superfamily enzyme